MRASFVLRVDPHRLPAGELVGEIEDVATGRTGGVRSVADVVAFCAAAGCPDDLRSPEPL